MRKGTTGKSGFGHWFAVAAFSLVVVLWGGTSGAQETGGAAYDVWLRAYMVKEEGMNAEKQGNLLLSLAKYDEAKRLFDAVSRDYPEFYADMVQLRRRELADKITWLRDVSHNSPNQSADPTLIARANGTEGPKPPTTGVVTPNPATQGQIEMGSREFQQAEALPTWGPPNPPSVATNSTGTVIRPPATAPSAPTTPAPPPAQAALATGDTSSALSSIQQLLNDKEARINQLQTLNLGLQQRLQEKENEMSSLRNKVTTAQANEARLRAEVEAMKQSSGTNEDAKARIAGLEKQLKEAMSYLKEATENNKEMLAQLESAKRELDDIKRQKAEIEKERDQFAAMVNTGDAGKQLTKLAEENKRLREELDQVRQVAETLKSESGKKDGEILILKEKIARIEDERKGLQAENARHQAHISELEKRLKALSQGLSGDAAELAKLTPEETQENELLRTIVIRQLRRQAQVKRTKDLVLTELTKLGVQSRTLLGLIDDIAAGSSLSDDEKKLFRNPTTSDLVDSTTTEPTRFTIMVEGTSAEGDENSVLEMKNLEEELTQIQKAASLDFKENRFKEAIAGYQKFLTYRPRSVTGLCNLALVHLKTKDYGEAQNLLEKAVAIQKDSGLAHYLLGRVFFSQERSDDALAQFSESLQYDPNNAKAHNCVGVISSQKGWANKAEESFTKAVKLDPNFGDAHFNLAVLYATKDEPNATKTQEHYFKAIHLGVPRDASIESFIGSNATKVSMNVTP